jgi:hypothetical protein
MEDCGIAGQVPERNTQGERRHSRPVNTWKDGTGDSMQSRNFKDEERFNQELWRKKLSHRNIPLTITNLHMKLKSNWPLHIHSVYISLHFNIIIYHFSARKYFYMQLRNMAKQDGKY